MASQQQRYDVTVYGATGFVGKLVIQHLISHPQFSSGEFTWAIAGRSSSKLQSVKESYRLPTSVGIVEADNTHPEKLADLAARSRVVINLVGPYGEYGSYKLAELCVQHKTHYVDLSGESEYNAQVVKSLHAKARDAGIVLAPSVGYDSLPPDLNTFLGVRALRNRPGGDAVAHIQAQSAHHVMGSASGGTVASLRHMASTAPWQIQPLRPNAMGDGVLSPSARDKARFAIHDPATWYLAHLNKYGFRSPFALHNTRTVYHSATLTDAATGDKSPPPQYGSTFQYLDVAVAAGPRSRIPAWLTLLLASVVSSVIKFTFFLMRVSPLVRRLSEKYIPVGSGPSPQAQRSGYCNVYTLVSGFKSAPTAHTSTATPIVSTQVNWKAPNADPGYLMTSRVISEVALLLVFSKQFTPGVRTGATIDPDGLVERLTRYANIAIEVNDQGVQNYKQGVLPVGA